MTAKSISKICSVGGCVRKSEKRGMCDTHYQCYRRTTPDFTPIINRGTGDTPEERFWSRVNINPDITECWEWTGLITTHGYGTVRLNNRPTKAHRAAWFYSYGSMPTLYLLHSCDNRRCVNPNHLREGTYQDNSDDKFARNRQAVGEAVNRGHLTTQDVIAIREKAPQMTRAALAAEYRVCTRTITDIVQRKAWRHC